MSANSWCPVYRFETIDLGTYRREDYFLTRFVDPEPASGAEYGPDEDADEYGVSLARSTPTGSNVELVPMETSHDRRHLDRVYLPPATERHRKGWLERGYI